MQQSQIEIQGSQVTISVRKAPLFIRVVLTVVLTVLILIPFIAIVSALISQSGPHILMLFMFIVFWGSGFYLLRVILWNSVGREILTLNPDNIVYIADFKHFKDGNQQVETNDMEVDIIYSDQADEREGRLVFKSPTSFIKTAIQAPAPELEELKSLIESRYTKAEEQLP